MEDTYKQLLAFTKLTNEFKLVQRQIYLPFTNRKENDAEHSYDLCMLIWYLGTILNMPIDINRAMKMGLVHDIVEAYVGDTCAFAGDEALLLQAQKEAEAIEQIKIDFPEFPDLVEAIEEYEMQETPEAKFAFCCDKLAPSFVEIHSGMRSSIGKGVSFQRLVSRRILFERCPEVLEIYDLLLDKFKEIYCKADRYDLLPI